MSDARHSLMSAIHSVLMDDSELDTLLAGNKVFDYVPRTARYPFISFGDCTSRVLDGDTNPTERHRFEVLIHSRTPSRMESSSIAVRVEALLHGSALSLSGYTLGSLRLTDTDVSPSRSRQSYRVRMRFEALTQTQ